MCLRLRYRYTHGLVSDAWEAVNYRHHCFWVAAVWWFENVTDTFEVHAAEEVAVRGSTMLAKRTTSIQSLYLSRQGMLVQNLERHHGQLC